MTEYRCEMTLEVRGEIRATAFPLRNYESIMRIRKQWYYSYGLATKKEWEIYFTHKSEMKQCKPFRIGKDFPYFIKSQIKQNEQSKSEPTNLYCEPVNLAGGFIQVVGKRQGEVL